MAILQLPVRNDLDQYEFSIDLDGISYVFEIQWNSRAEYWSIIIKTPQNVTLAGALPLRVNSDLYIRFRDANLPPGQMILFDRSGQNLECGKADLGDRCVLLYEEATV